MQPETEMFRQWIQENHTENTGCARPAEECRKQGGRSPDPNERHDENADTSRKDDRTENRGRLLAALLAAVLFTMGLTACGQGDVSTSSTTSSQGQTESGTSSASSAVERIEEKDVEDTLEGLTKYMANNYSLGEAFETRGDMIGAQKKGYRYSTQTVQGGILCI